MSYCGRQWNVMLRHPFKMGLTQQLWGEWLADTLSNIMCTKTFWSLPVIGEKWHFSAFSMHSLIMNRNEHFFISLFSYVKNYLISILLRVKIKKKTLKSEEIFIRGVRREEVILGDSVRWFSMYLTVITSGLSVSWQPGSPRFLPRWPPCHCNISHQFILNASHKLFDEGSSSPRSVENAVFLLLLLSYLGITSHPDTLSIHLLLLLRAASSRQEAKCCLEPGLTHSALENSG